MAWRSSPKKIHQTKLTPAIASFLLLICLSSCSSGPEPIKTGTDNCYFCKMTISDVRFGAELITTKGKVYKFDDVHCIVSHLQTKDGDSAQLKDVYLTNYCNDHQLINVKKCSLLKSEDLKSPMGGNVAAFDNSDSLLKIKEHYPGDLVNWNELLKQ